MKPSTKNSEQEASVDLENDFEIGPVSVTISDPTMLHCRICSQPLTILVFQVFVILLLYYISNYCFFYCDTYLLLLILSETLNLE